MVYVGMIQISWVLLLLVSLLLPAAAMDLLVLAAAGCCCRCWWLLLLMSLLVPGAAMGLLGACCCLYGCNKTHSLVSSKDTTPLAESLAGAIVCAVIASGRSMKEALDATKVLAEDCRLRGTAFRLGAVLRELLVKFLPDDVHTRSNGRVRVAVTQILWRPRGLLVDQFDSKEDLINAVFTSSFIPGYLAPRPATLFRNRVCIDGGVTLFMPPTSASKTVRVCAFPAERLGLEGIGISPDCNPENRASAGELFNWALEPAEDHVLDRLFELGYLDASVWADQNPVEEIVTDDTTPGTT